MELALEFWTFGRVKSTTVAHFYAKMELAPEFWTLGRVKSTTAAHFCSGMSLALGFWTSDVRHSRVKSSVLGPDGRHARVKRKRRSKLQGLGFRVFMFLDMSLGLLKRPKRAQGSGKLPIDPQRRPRASEPRAPGLPRGGAVPLRMGGSPHHGGGVGI